MSQDFKQRKKQYKDNLVESVASFTSIEDPEQLSKQGKRKLIKELAKFYKIPKELAYAFLTVETGNMAFCENGLMKIRFEPHVFCGAAKTGRNMAKIFDFDYKATPWYDVSTRQAKLNWKSLGYSHGSRCTTQYKEWFSLMNASAINQLQAFASISMGLPQIMGYSYKKLGYKTPVEMFESFSKSESAQIISFFRYISVRGRGHLLMALQKKDFAEAAKFYNGNAVRKNNPWIFKGIEYTVKKDFYGAKIEHYYNKYKNKGLP